MIRRLTADDAPAVSACFIASYASPWSLIEITNSLNTPSNIGWGFESGQDLQAFILFQTAHIEADMLILATHPDTRNLGHAHQLWKTAKTALITKGIQTIYLDVSQINVPAMKFYTKMGFTKQGVRPRYYKTDSGRVDAIIMRFTMGSEEDKI